MSINPNNNVSNDPLNIVFVSNTRNPTPIQNNEINKPPSGSMASLAGNTTNLCWKIVDGNPLRETDENGIKKNFLCIELNQKIHVNGASKPLYAFLPIEGIADLTSYDSKKLISKFSQLQSLQNKGKLDPNNEIVLAISYLCKKYNLDKSVQPVAKMALEQGISQVSLGEGLSGTRVQELRNQGKSIKIEDWLETNKKALEDNYRQLTQKDADEKGAPLVDSAKQEKINALSFQLRAIYNELDETKFKTSELNSAPFKELNKRKWVNYIGNAGLLENRKRVIQNEIDRLKLLNQKRHDTLVLLKDEAGQDNSGLFNGPRAKHDNLLKLVAETDNEIKTLTDEMDKLEADSKKESLYSKVSSCFERFKKKKSLSKDETEDSFEDYDKNNYERLDESESPIHQSHSRRSSTHTQSPGTRFSISESQANKTSKLIGSKDDDKESEEKINYKPSQETEEEWDLETFLTTPHKPSTASSISLEPTHNQSSPTSVLKPKPAGQDLSTPPLESFSQQPASQLKPLNLPPPAPFEPPVLVLTPFTTPSDSSLRIQASETETKINPENQVSLDRIPLSDFEKALVKRLSSFNSNSTINRESELMSELNAIQQDAVVFFAANEARFTKNQENPQLRYIYFIKDIIDSCKDVVDESYQKFLEQTLIKTNGEIDIDASVEKYLVEREKWNAYIEGMIKSAVDQIANSKLDFSSGFLKRVITVFWKIKLTPNLFLDWQNPDRNNYVQDTKGTTSHTYRTDWKIYPPLFKYQNEHQITLRNKGYMPDGNDNRMDF